MGIIKKTHYSRVRCLWRKWLLSWQPFWTCALQHWTGCKERRVCHKIQGKVNKKHVSLDCGWLKKGTQMYVYWPDWTQNGTEEVIVHSFAGHHNVCQDCVQHSLRFNNDSSTSCGETKIFHCVNINMINISASIRWSLMVRSWYVTIRAASARACVWNHCVYFTGMLHRGTSGVSRGREVRLKDVQSRNKPKKKKSLR